MSPAKQLVVTIDGPAGAGKSTVAKRLARGLGYRLLDTGAIYRAVALVARRRGIDWADAEALAVVARDLDVRFAFVGEINHVSLGEEDVTAAIRTPEISSGASQVSAHPPVRAALLDLQRRLGAEGGVVVEGRDTGSVVFPDAEAKFYLTASDEVRAQRRLEELHASGVEADYEATIAAIRERDERDSNRAVAPLTRPADAVLVDSSAVDIDHVVATIEADVRRRATATP
jgi:cytidylate kinase